MVWKQKVLPAISAVMWIFLVKMPTLKPQDCALECVYYRGGMTNTDLSSHITCGMDGSHFLMEETTCQLKLLVSNLCVVSHFFMLLDFNSFSVLSLTYLSLH